MRSLIALGLLVANGTVCAQAIQGMAIQSIGSGAILNTTNVLNASGVTTTTGGSLTLGGGGVPPTLTTNPIVNQSAGSITLRANSGLSTLQAPKTAATVAPTATNTTFVSNEATRLTLTAMPGTMPAFPQLREGVFVQPGTALTTSSSARQAILIDGRIRFTQ